MNAQFITGGIKHCYLGSYSSIPQRFKFAVTGQESIPHSPMILYFKPLDFII